MAMPLCFPTRRNRGNASRTVRVSGKEGKIPSSAESPEAHKENGTPQPLGVGVNGAGATSVTVAKPLELDVVAAELDETDSAPSSSDAGSVALPPASPCPAVPDTPEERALAGLRAEMERRGECIAHLSRADLLRWLRARKLHVGKSSDFLQADLAWRRKHRIEERSGEDADAVLGCEVAKLKAFLPHENPPCLDRRGRPVIIKHFGHVYFSRLLNSTNITLDQLSDYNWWVNEQYTRRLNEVGAEQWLIICDAKGFSPTQMDRVALKVLKSMANIDADHYPERLGGFVIINAPASLAFVWKIVSAWLDEKTKAKVQIISAGEPKRAREHLHSLIDPAQLPAQYGGTAPALEEWPAWPAKSGVPPPKASPAK